jgi:vacuolar-type H+-ATPase subunit F/Vma7
MGGAFGVQVLCGQAVSTGFALAGLRTAEVSGVEDAAARLREAMARHDVGVVLMEQALYDALPEDLRRQLGKRPLPMVVPFPEPAWAEKPEAPEAYIVELLRQVIGYRVRLK